MVGASKLTQLISKKSTVSQAPVRPFITAARLPLSDSVDKSESMSVLAAENQEQGILLRKISYKCFETLVGPILGQQGGRLSHTRPH